MDPAPTLPAPMPFTATPAAVQLLLGTAAVAGVVGVGAAWLVTAFRFPAPATPTASTSSATAG